MPAEKYIPTHEFIQYDGTNGAEVVAYIGGHIVTDTGTLLQISFDPVTHEVALTFNLGDWYSHQVGPWVTATFPHQYASLESMAPGTDQVGMTEAVSIGVPLLLLGGSVDRVVAWAAPFPDTSYKVRFLPDANSLGRVTATVKAGTKTVNGLTVTLTAGLAVTVAGVVHVMGTT